jgi:hypothetical protein
MNTVCYSYCWKHILYGQKLCVCVCVCVCACMRAVIHKVGERDDEGQHDSITLTHQNQNDHSRANIVVSSGFYKPQVVHRDFHKDLGNIK